MSSVSSASVNQACMAYTSDLVTQGYMEISTNDQKIAIMIRLKIYIYIIMLGSKNKHIKQTYRITKWYVDLKSI